MRPSFAWVGWVGATLLVAGSGCGGGGGSQTPPATTPPAGGATVATTPPAGGGGAGGGGGGGGDMSTEAVAAGSSEEAQRGIKAFQAGDMDGAKTAFTEAVKKHPKDGEAVYYLGLVAEKQGDKKTAEADYKKALELRPDLENAAVNLGALYIDSNRYDEALLVTRQGLQKHPQTAQLQMNLAIGLANKGDEGASERAFQDVIKAMPNDANAHFVHGHWLAVWKHADEAAAELRAARPLAQNDVGVLAAIGHEFATIRDPADCVPTFDKAIQIKDAAELRTERALCKLAAKDEAGAQSDLEAAVGSDASFAPAHFWLGNLYAKKDKLKEAQTQYEAYLKLQPSGPLAKQAQAHLKAVKAGPPAKKK